MEIPAKTLYRSTHKRQGGSATEHGTMTPAHASATTQDNAALRRAARTLIASMLTELVHQDQDWIGACRKRIKDRMSNAKHIIFNNERKIGLMLLGRTDEIPALEFRNRQMEHTVLVCSQALDILDGMGTETAPQPAAQRRKSVAQRVAPTQPAPITH
jgi:hypothetical protein